MAKWKFEFTNYKQIKRKLRKLRSIQDEYMKTLSQEAELIMGESKELVPVDTGALKSTGHVTPPRKTFSSVFVDLGYGGVASNGEQVDYALFVHENLEAFHKVGQAKYLELPVKKNIKTVQKALDRATKRAIRNAGL